MMDYSEFKVGQIIYWIDQRPSATEWPLVQVGMVHSLNPDARGSSERVIVQRMSYGLVGGSACSLGHLAGVLEQTYIQPEDVFRVCREGIRTNIKALESERVELQKKKEKRSIWLAMSEIDQRRTFATEPKGLTYDGSEWTVVCHQCEAGYICAE